MNLKISTVLLLCLLFSCKQEKEVVRSDKDTLKSSALIEADSLLLIQDQNDFVIIDFRNPEDFLKAHIPGAVNIWRTDLENPNYPYGGMMPEKKDFEQLLGELGIHNNHQLVVYDDKGSVDAARLWWLFRYYYINDVRVLNGGLRAWREAGGPVSVGKTTTQTSQFILRGNSDTFRSLKFPQFARLKF